MYGYPKYTCTSTIVHDECGHSCAAFSTRTYIFVYSMSIFPLLNMNWCVPSLVMLRRLADKLVNPIATSLV